MSICDLVGCEVLVLSLICEEKSRAIQAYAIGRIDENTLASGEIFSFGANFLEMSNPFYVEMSSQ